MVLSTAGYCNVQWNLHIRDTTRASHFVLCKEVVSPLLGLAVNNVCL